MPKLGFAGVILIGGFMGALLVSVIAHLIFTIATPRAVQDGQYGMIFMGTVPVGWLLGSAVGTASAWRIKTRPRHAGWVAGLLIAGGVLGGPFLAPSLVVVVALAWSLLHPHG